MATPQRLAAQVVARMTRAEKVGFVELDTHGQIENLNSGIPALCIPSLTLVAGPNGLAYGLRGVTQPKQVGED